MRESSPAYVTVYVTNIVIYFRISLDDIIFRRDTYHDFASPGGEDAEIGEFSQWTGKVHRSVYYKNNIEIA